MRLTPLPAHFLKIESFPNSDHPDFFHAAFLLTGETQRILRDWKKRPSLGIEKTIEETDSFQLALGEIQKHRFDAIIPIPQGYSRAFRLRGGPANRLAEILARKLQIPKVSGLAQASEAHSPQGEKVGVSRYLNRREYFWERIEKIPKRILVVDDFWTSGQTIRAATRSLRRDGCLFVGAFVLGLRPFLNQTGREDLGLKLKAELNPDRVRDLNSCG